MTYEHSQDITTLAILIDGNPMSNIVISELKKTKTLEEHHFRVLEFIELLKAPK